MKNILIFIGGVAVGILAVTGIYALDDDGPGESCGDADQGNEEMDDLDEEEVDGRLEELLEPDGAKFEDSVVGGTRRL